MKILGIETSCDETAAAVLEVKNGRFSVLSNVVASQVKIHAKTGGVVPEVAAREHAEKIIPVIERALLGVSKVTKVAKVTKKETFATSATFDTSGSFIDAIAVTVGPGLITSLLVGAEAARTLAYLWKKPLVAVNHLEGHIYANWLPLTLPSPARGEGIDGFEFPALCLVVSGGHTELVLMRKHMDYKIIGVTRDDAVGECFDKVAKMLGLGYPGGPIVARLAEEYHTDVIAPPHCRGKQSRRDCHGLRSRDDVHFPRPMISSPDFDFSFAGLKTAVLYYVKDLLKQKGCENCPTGQFLPRHILQNICASFEEAAVDVLVSKTIKAARKYKIKTIMLGGGVAANQRLREQLVVAIERELPTTHYSLPPLQYTSDNAAMIATAGYFHALKNDFTPWAKLEADPNLSI